MAGKVKPLDVERETRPAKYLARDGLVIASAKPKNWNYRYVTICPQTSRTITRRFFQPLTVLYIHAGLEVGIPQRNEKRTDGSSTYRSWRCRIALIAASAIPI